MGMLCRFDNKALAMLPIDMTVCTEQHIHEGLHTISRENVKQACFSWCMPTAVIDPEVVVVSEEALALLDLGKEDVSVQFCFFSRK